MKTLHTAKPTAPLTSLTPEQKTRFNILNEEWQILKGYVGYATSEGGEHQRVLCILEGWNGAQGKELKMPEELEWRALHKAYGILQRQKGDRPTNLPFHRRWNWRMVWRTYRPLVYLVLFGAVIFLIAFLCAELVLHGLG